jgi:acyl-CoA dehydrogenase
MPDRSFLAWPFFEPRHRVLAGELEAWAGDELADLPEENVEATCRELVARLAAGGWLRHAVPAPFGGIAERLDVRSLCLIRETLARHAALADFAFAMQGLGVGAISLFGSEEQKSAWLPAVAEGRAIPGFAISEPDAGSDVAAIATTATATADGFALDGEKTWISNGGIADLYVVIARTGEAPGARGLSAFVVPADTAGLEIAGRIEIMAPHPLARLRLSGCRIPRSALIGEPGQGFRITMATLDVFRSTVGAAALGFARRALDEALERASGRMMFGAPLADLQLTRGRLADMATAIDAAALLVYRAAWAKDAGAARVTREAAMAKLFATEAAQEVIDGAVQIHGALGLVSGHPVERLYREIRALRIYEGASEVQKIVVARELTKAHGGGQS